MKLRLHRRQGRAATSGAVQELRVRFRGGYTAEAVRGRGGEPVALVVRREDASPVGERLIVPALGRSVSLPLHQDVRVDLGTPPRGEYLLTSETGAVRGTLVLE